MSETNQEDLSVEDILSSIKNILVDENGVPQEEPASAAPTNTSDQTDGPVKRDDVFDLDTSMIVEEQKQTAETPAEESSVSEIIAEPEQNTTPEEQEAQPAEPENTAPANTSLADSIDIEQTMKMAENIDLSTIEGLEIAPTDTTEEKPAEEEATPVDQEAIDASANIINNFAKVFAEKRQEQLQTEPNTTDTAEKVSAQLENLNISQQIENAIVEQVKSGIEANFDRLATDIIAKQTREWLNENLVSIVEKTVAKEIERVIAKVGS